MTPKITVDVRRVAQQIGMKPFNRQRTPLAVYLAALTITVAMNDTRRIETVVRRDVIK